MVLDGISFLMRTPKLIIDHWNMMSRRAGAKKSKRVVPGARPPALSARGDTWRMVVGPLPARLCRLSFRLRRRGALQLCDPRRESRELRLSRGRGPRAAVRVNLLPQLPSSDRHCGPLRRRQHLAQSRLPSIPLASRGGGAEEAAPPAAVRGASRADAGWRRGAPCGRRRHAIAPRCAAPIHSADAFSLGCLPHTFDAPRFVFVRLLLLLWQRAAGER